MAIHRQITWPVMPLYQMIKVIHNGTASRWCKFQEIQTEKTLFNVNWQTLIMFHQKCVMKSWQTGGRTLHSIRLIGLPVDRSTNTARAARLPHSSEQHCSETMTSSSLLSTAKDQRAAKWMHSVCARDSWQHGQVSIAAHQLQVN